MSRPNIDGHLRRLAEGVPKPVKLRMLSALEHFERSFQLIDIDREMASFRAITGEEEAATGLMKAVQLRKYPHSNELNSRDHQHKAAVIACMVAMAQDVRPILREFQLDFDFQKKRIDLKIPLSNFNVVGGQYYAVQLVEPLDVTRHQEGLAEEKVFQHSLQKLAETSNFNDIRRMVSAQANGRNTLLYASDSALPKSSATKESILNRKNRTLTLMVLSVMILQSRKHQSLVCQAISAFLAVISRLPRPSVEEA